MRRMRSCNLCLEKSHFGVPFRQNFQMRRVWKNLQQSLFIERAYQQCKFLGPFKVQFKSISVLYFNYFFFLIFRSILKFPVRCAAKWSAKANSITTCNKNTCRPVRKSTNVTIVAKVSVKQVGCAITSTCTLVKSLTNVDFATLDLQALATKQRMNEVIWD